MPGIMSEGSVRGVDSRCVGRREIQSGLQAFWIGSHLQKRFGHSPKENSINDLRVLQSQRSQFPRQGKDDVTIGNGQNLRGPVPQPLIPCPAVALWAMAVAAGSIGDPLMSAMITLLHLRAKRGCTTRADVSECFALLR